ncbi:MAG: hemin transporter HemP [Betaproteobacteria bacterium RIFCSPLOWO2_12_FULL_62_13]|nr:MAG: hemin transporter HemP [Betaproteobacteria bacterium RIFCSPLOWO2_12_FULL_62_13]
MGTRRVTSDALLAGGREVVIEHAGREYRLRLTSNGKLILTA